MPKFSIVIPTHARADTLIHALGTATYQDYDDLDILVHESGDDAETARVLAAVADRRVRHIKTVEPVSMTENWERSLACATGEYVTFIGDDDGMLPDACTTAARILDRNSADLLSWRPACYFWPAYCNAPLRNRLLLYLHRPDTVEEVSSRVTLELVYRFRSDYSVLPMIYNSFVSRALVRRVQAEAGCYFIGSAPDVTSGIVNALFSETFLLSGRPLSSSGLSHNSTGHRMFFSNDDSLRRDATAQAFPANDREAVYRNLQLFVGEEMRKVKERLFPNQAPSLHYRNMLWSALQSAHGSFGASPATIGEIRSAALRWGVAIEDWIEPPQVVGPAEARGIRASGDDILMDIDCARAGITNIREVTRLLSALAPACESPEFVRPAEPLRSLAPDRDTALRFSRNGNGLLFLGYGWSEPEQWGVWSLGRCCEISLAFSARPLEAIALRIDGRMPVHSRRPRARGTILCNGRPMAEFEASCECPGVSVDLRIPPEDIGNGELVIGFELEPARSPAEDGIGGDVRRLGFGLEEIRISCAR